MMTPHTLTYWLDSLQTHGCHITMPRRIIVEMLLASTRALSPLELFEISRLRYPRIGLVTVYRTLEKLEELGLVQRVHQPGGCHMFIRSACGHEHLLICTRCGKAQFFEGDQIDSLIHRVEQETQFQIQDHWLQLMGECPDCRKAV